MEEAGVSWGHTLFSQLSAPVVAEWRALSSGAFKAGFMGNPSAVLMPVPHGILLETLFCLSNSQPDLLVYCLRLILFVISGKNCLRLPRVSNLLDDLFRPSLKSIACTWGIISCLSKKHSGKRRTGQPVHSLANFLIIYLWGKRPQSGQFRKLSFCSCFVVHM